MALQCIQFCRMIYKDHPDVYHFFMEGVEQKLLNSKVLIGSRWTKPKMNHAIIFATLINFNH